MRRLLRVSLALALAAAVLTAAIVLARRPSSETAASGREVAPDRGPASAPATSAGRRATTPAQVASQDAPSRHAPRPGGPAQAAPVWVVDKAASRLSFKGVMNGVSFDGVFRDWDAQIAFDPANLAASRAVVTVNTGSALTGEPLKDQALPNSEWLDVQTYPQARLTTRSLSQVGPGRYLALVDVRVRGVRWRTSVPFTVATSHDQGRMQATLSLDRRTFGIGEGPFQSPAPVEPTVQVTLKLSAKRSE